MGTNVERGEITRERGLQLENISEKVITHYFGPVDRGEGGGVRRCAGNHCLCALG